MHTGEIQLRDEGNYAGPTINRTARLRDLGHGGQTLLSGATEALVLDRLPDDAWLTDLGTHPLRDLPRPERVVQLCHPDLVNEFPPLRIAENCLLPTNLPVQLTSFVGRDAELTQLRELLAENRLVTLTGAGGVGKTRLAIQVARQHCRRVLPTGCGTWIWRRSLTPSWCRSRWRVHSGCPTSPAAPRWTRCCGSSRDRQMLVVLDNCEHLLDASAELVVAVLSACRAIDAACRPAVSRSGWPVR